MSTRTINPMADWLSVNDHDNLSGDGRVTNIVTENNGRSSRSINYKIRKGANELERTVTVNQAGRPLYVVFDGSPYTAGATDTSILIHGKTNASTLVFQDSQQTGERFVSLDSNGYKQYSNGSPTGNFIQNGTGPTSDPGANGEWEFCMVISLAENETISQRSNTIKVIAEANGQTPVEATATITQSAGDAYLKLSVGPNGQQVTTGVTVGFNWDGTLASGTDSADVYVWCNTTWELTSGS